jgi:hypothetical protein
MRLSVVQISENRVADSRVVLTGHDSPDSLAAVASVADDHGHSVATDRSRGSPWVKEVSAVSSSASSPRSS